MAWPVAPVTPGLVNPTMPPTVEEFRKMFPEFAEVSDEHVQVFIDIGCSWVDPRFWFSPDAKVAAMFAAAHYLSMQDKASGGELTGSTGGGVTPPGGAVDPELGKIWVKSVRFRDRSVTYDRVSLTDQKKTNSADATKTASSEFWNATLYGQLYLSYRRRNVSHVAVI